MEEYNPAKDSRLTKKERRIKRQNKEISDRSHNSMKLIRMAPMTDNQRKTFDAFNDGYNLLLTGTAGTGKSFLSIYLALNENFKPEAQQNNIIIIRSVVPTRDMGFLPGNNMEKSRVYEAPYYSIMTELFGRGDAYDILKQGKNVNFMSTSFVRGITLKNSIVIVDEIQNMTASELHSIFTRIGTNCRVILAGDIKQNDLIQNREKSGFNDFFKIITKLKSFKSIEFNANDIVRSDLVREYIIIRESMEKNHEIDPL